MNDDLLRRDVRLLGDLLGDVIQEMAGPQAFDCIERIRKISRDRRAGLPEAESDLIETITELDETNARIVSRAFSIYFDLANLAEDRHRVRILRLREEERYAGPRSESIGEAILQLRQAGLSATEVQSALDHLAVELVFTAHPSEAKRRSHRTKIRQMRQALEDLDRVDLLSRERQKLEDRLRIELTVLWQSEFLRPSRPTVLQEVRRGLSIAPRLWEVVPQIYEDMRKALETSYPGTLFQLPVFLKFGSWIGGDRDGHPHVTCDVTEKTLLMLREAAIQAHLSCCRRLTEFLSLSENEAPFSEEIKNRITAAVTDWPVLEAELESVPPKEICRRWLTIIEWRLKRSLVKVFDTTPLPGAYRDGPELAADIQALIESLHANRAKRLIGQELTEWLDLVCVFGLHMNRLDVRQDARVYREVMRELFAKQSITEDFTALSEPERQAVLAGSLPWTHEIPDETLTQPARETLKLFRLLHHAMSKFGGSCLGCHVISMTSTASDVLTVLWLWRWAQAIGCPPGTDVAALTDQLPIVPLFEKIGDLKNAATTLEAILKNPVYAAHLARQGGRQVVMIGYSDSTKDGGYLAACWGLYRAQVELQQVADRYGVKLTFFHGRGGSLGRGGGPAARGIHSLPPEALDGSLRLTEQGEVLAERYDDDQIAFRHLEQVTTATLLASAQPAAAVESSWVEIMEQLSQRSYQEYRKLVDQPGFIEYFGSATPIDEIESLNIGSRPARRYGERTLADLRAIPWVFSWTQNRCLIPAWYGMGAALEEIEKANPAGWQSVCEMYQKWSFFRATIDNAALALAKADPFIAAQYAQLVENSDVRQRIWTKISNERDRAVHVILKLSGVTNLLSATPWLQSSIEVRNPYIDPLNLIQIELIRRRRRLQNDADSEELERIRSLSRLTVQGIAAGMRTTG